MNVTEFEWGAALLTIWVVTFFALWRFVDRPDRPGIIKGQLTVEHFLLAHILLLIIAVCLLVKGSGLFG